MSSKQLKLKSTATMELDTAIWSLEGLLNYEIANNNHPEGEKEFYYDSLVVTAIDGTISLSQLAEAYGYFTDKLTQYVASRGEETLVPDIVDLELDSTAVSESTEKTLYFTTALKKPVYLPDLYWFSPNEEYGWYIDAPNQLKNRINTHIAIRQYSYYIDVERITTMRSSFPDPNFPLNRWEPFMIFQGSHPDFFVTLNATELNYYLSKIGYISETLCPFGKDFLAIDIRGQFFTDLGGSKYKFHSYYLSYATAVYTGPAL